MNIASLKNRVKRLEPKNKADHYFGELHINDPHVYNREGENYTSSWRIFGRFSGLPCCVESGYCSGIEDGIEKLKRAFRKNTTVTSNIFHLETKNNEFHLNTIYSLEGTKIIDKYPGGINELAPDMLTRDSSLGKMSDVECIAFFNDVVY